MEAVDGMEDVGAWFEENMGGHELLQDSTVENVSEGKEAQLKVDWEVVDADWEKRWDLFREVGGDGWKALRVGSLVGWKVNLTPILLHPNAIEPPL